MTTCVKLVDCSLTAGYDLSTPQGCIDAAMGAIRNYKGTMYTVVWHWCADKKDGGLGRQLSELASHLGKANSTLREYATALRKTGELPPSERANKTTGMRRKTSAPVENSTPQPKAPVSSIEVAAPEMNVEQWVTDSDQLPPGILAAPADADQALLWASSQLVQIYALLVQRSGEPIPSWDLSAWEDIEREASRVQYQAKRAVSFSRRLPDCRDRDGGSL